MSFYRRSNSVRLLNPSSFNTVSSLHSLVFHYASHVVHIRYLTRDMFSGNNLNTGEWSRRTRAEVGGVEGHQSLKTLCGGLGKHHGYSPNTQRNKTKNRVSWKERWWLQPLVSMFNFRNQQFIMVTYILELLHTYIHSTCNLYHRWIRTLTSLYDG